MHTIPTHTTIFDRILATAGRFSLVLTLVALSFVATFWTLRWMEGKDCEAAGGVYVQSANGIRGVCLRRIDVIMPSIKPAKTT